MRLAGSAGFVPIKNRRPARVPEPAAHIVSPDALALVRFGLRAADDPRIVNTVKVIDALLKVETPCGPAWHRYNDDGYGEHDDGSPFDGTGIGRAWPLLTGERAHYELAAGRRTEAERLKRTMEAFANEGGMLPEQVWDAPDIPEQELFFGQPSGSAMPLVWAHAEYVKLRRSLHDGRVFDMPPQTVERYQVNKAGSPIRHLALQPQVPDPRAGQDPSRRGAGPGHRALEPPTAGARSTTHRRRTRDSGSIVPISLQSIFLSTGPWNSRSIGPPREGGKAEISPLPCRSSGDF